MSYPSNSNKGPTTNHHQSYSALLDETLLRNQAEAHARAFSQAPSSNQRRFTVAAPPARGTLTRQRLLAVLQEALDILDGDEDDEDMTL